MKLPNDLIKATDYDKAKDRIIKEFECVNGKVIQHYVLGGEHELTMQEIIDCLNALATIDCDLQTAYAYIEGQKDKLTDLEAKLAESKKKASKNYQEGYDLYLSLKQFYSRLGVEAYPDNEIQDVAIKELNKLLKENDQLKQQLAEKDAEIDELRFRERNINGLIEQLPNQNQTAIDELEKLKEKALHFLVQNTEKLSGFYVDIEEIDQQIKSLKGEK